MGGGGARIERRTVACAMYHGGGRGGDGIGEAVTFAEDEDDAAMYHGGGGDADVEEDAGKAAASDAAASDGDGVEHTLQAEQRQTGVTAWHRLYCGAQNISHWGLSHVVA